MSASYRLPLLVFSVSLCLCGSLPASQLKEPYRVRIVVHVERHRLLTDIFRKQLMRELGDWTQTGLGALAKVEVTDTHPHLLTVRTQGLGRALDGYRER